MVQLSAIILWWLLPILLTLEDPIYTGAPYAPDDPTLRGNRQVDGDQKRIPSSLHNQLDDVRRELRRSKIRYGRRQYRRRPERRVLSHPPRIKRAT